MTHEKQRIAIAKACGWKDIKHCTKLCSLYDKLVGINPDITRKGYDAFMVPDYLNDLNACARMERTLMDYDYVKFKDYLQTITIREMIPLLLISAPAHMRCEAFLKTLGKWEATP